MSDIAILRQLTCRFIGMAARITSGWRTTPPEALGRSCDEGGFFELRVRLRQRGCVTIAENSVLRAASLDHLAAPLMMCF